ncbi:MAG: TonB-dependent receptor [Pyrinomonadaceae bacterium]|nr:TonB-dependent receptor [Pyrinomonadaceae bacterium]
MKQYLLNLFAILFVFSLSVFAQNNIKISGVVVTPQNELVPNVTVSIRTSDGKKDVQTDAEGNFSLEIPKEAIMISVSGKNIQAKTFPFSIEQLTGELRLVISYTVAPIHEELVIVADSLEPQIERRNEKVYKDTLFSRDDQIFQTLDAGINAGQHEGGGKSLEIRRFGFNLDHGGVNGGLKVLSDNVQQNQGTQGHGQGYLGSLKSLSPELVQGVEIINGPFSAEYGDFSSLGVVHIRTRESLPQQGTARIQGGRFNTIRTFFAYSPPIKDAAFFAWEHSQTDGPFKSPLKYKRENFTGNYTFKLNENRALGFKFNGGTNKYNSSGQIPLDLVANGELDRFGFLDKDNGGKQTQGTLGIYFRNETKSGEIFKIDGFVSRSLFDLWSNFTFFLNDDVNGDEVQQHDSRLQQGVNAQYLKPVKFGKGIGVFTVGGNFHANQINVGLDKTIGRNPFEIVTKANAKVNNYATYAQQTLDLFDGHLNLNFGIRYDYFSFKIDDRVNPNQSGKEGQGRFQPKFSASYTPNHEVPFTLHFNYGRGITSQDARGVVQQPENPKIAITDFYQAGTSFNSQKFSFTFSGFLINRSNEQVYIPDDGSIELTDPSRSYGFETKTSIKLNKYVSFNGGITNVLNAYFRNTNPRIYLDSSPRFTANAGFTLDDLKGFSGSLRYRHINNYRLDGEDETLRASGFDVVDLSVNKRVTRFMDLNFSLDNLFNKRYYETQNYFESRICPTCDVTSRIHATPSYPITLTIGATFRFGKKD